MRILRTSLFSLALSLGLGSAVCLADNPAPAPGTPGSYGAPLSKQAPVPLAKVLGDPDAFAGKSVVVEGTVRATCQKKGCWMELAQGAEKSGQGCRITFKDYGFFVPVNSTGSAARVEGVVDVRKVPKEQVDHLEGEGAHFAKKDKDGSAREVRIVASGVELRKK